MRELRTWKFHKSTTKVKRGTVAVVKPAEQVYTDVVGTMKAHSLAKSKYFVTLTVECSKYSLVRFIHQKSKAASRVIKIIREVENFFNSAMRNLSCINRNNVKWMRSDGGRECVGHDFQTGGNNG